MATIGSLNVDLSMKTARFSSDVAKAKKEANSLKNSIKRDMQTIQRATDSARKSFNTFATVGIGAAAAGMALIVTRSLETGDALAKTADKIGIATEQLAGLRHAAELTGVNANTLDMALQRMTRRLAEAAQGTGEAKDAIKTLGLEAVELNRAGPDEAFRMIADAMEKVPQQSEKVRLAFKLFDSEGVALVNTLAAGREGLDAMTQEAIDLGIALNRVQTAKIEAANDAIARSGEAFAGVGNKFTVAVAPFIVAFSNKLTAIIKQSGDMSTSVSGGFDKIADAVGFVADAVRGLEVVFKTINLAAVAFVAGAITALDELQQAAVAIANVLPGVDIAPNAELSRWAEESRATVVQLGEELDALIMRPMPAAEVKKFMQGVQAEATRAAEEIAAQAQARATSTVSGTGGSTEKQAQAIERQASFYQRLSDMAEEAGAKDEELAILKFNRDLERIEEHHAKLIELGMSRQDAEAAMRQAAEDAEAVHMARIVAIRERGLSAVEKFSAMSWGNQAKTMIGMLEQMTASASTQSRAMFEVNKAAALANAVVKGVEAVQSAYAFGSAFGGPIGGVAMATIAAASAAANVAKIASTSFGGGGAGAIGGGGGGGGSVGGGVPSQAATVGAPVSETGENGRGGTQVTVIVQALDPSSVTEDTMRRFGENLAPHIQDAERRGINNVVVANG